MRRQLPVLLLMWFGALGSCSSDATDQQPVDAASEAGSDLQVDVDSQVADTGLEMATDDVSAADGGDTHDAAGDIPKDAVHDGDAVQDSVADTPADSGVDTSQQIDSSQDAPVDSAKDVAEDGGETDGDQHGEAQDTGEGVCTIQQCTDYVTCQTYEACGPCPEKPAELCNGVDDDCDSETDKEGDPLNCPAGQLCRGGHCCADECELEGEKECLGSAQFKTCGNSDGDPCLEWSVSDCDPGSDCIEGTCVCTPQSCLDFGYNCGIWSDGCDGTLDCGTCGANETCDGGTCQCATPCGSVCCDSGDVCRNDVCCTPHDHDGCHSGDVYWFDSCGNSEQLKQDCTGGQVCYQGACCLPDSCQPQDCGEVDDGCGGTLTCSTEFNPYHCGACGMACGEQESCNSGRCCCGSECGGVGAGSLCAAGQSCCPSDGCVDLMTDDNNCSQCGTDCTTMPFVQAGDCVDGDCHFVCDTGRWDCDDDGMEGGTDDENGCEKHTDDFASDPNNCGDCDFQCMYDGTCVDGGCVCGGQPCGEGWFRCDSVDRCICGDYKICREGFICNDEKLCACDSPAACAGKPCELATGRCDCDDDGFFDTCPQGVTCIAGSSSCKCAGGDCPPTYPYCCTAADPKQGQCCTSKLCGGVCFHIQEN